MATGNLRWTIPFMSATGVACRIDIYDNDGWSGQVTTLTAGGSPVVIEEDDDDDLLSTVRYKTGSIEIFQPEGVDLSEIVPSVNDEHYIEIYRGTLVVCKGYLQASSFKRDYDPSADILELTFVSPLGLASSKFFSIDDAPYYKQVKYILKEVVEGICDSYSQFIVPDPLNGSSMYELSTVDGWIDSSVLMESVKNVRYPAKSKHWKANSYQDFLEKLATYMGCIVHDDGVVGIVFQRVNYGGSYSVINTQTLSRSRINAVNGSTETPLLDTLTISGKAEKEKVMPLSSISVEYSYMENNSTVRLPFDNCYRVAVRSERNNLEVIQNVAVNSDLTADNLLPANGFYIDSNGKMTEEGTFFAGMFDISEDNPSVNEMIICRGRITSSSQQVNICKYTIYGGIRSTTCTLKCKCMAMADDDLYRLFRLTSLERNFRIRLYIRNLATGKYYNFDDYTWQNTATYKILDHENEIHLNSSTYWDNGIELTFVGTNPNYLTNPTGIWAIKEFSIEDVKYPVWEYQNDEDNEYEIIGNYPGFDSADIGIDIAPRYYGNSHSRMSRSYEYLLEAQNRVEIPVQGTMPSYPYIRKYTLPNFNNKFRLLADIFDLREDEHTLILQGGPTI